MLDESRILHLILVLVYKISRDEIYFGKENWQRPQGAEILFDLQFAREWVPSFPPSLPVVGDTKTFFSLFSFEEADIWVLWWYLKDVIASGQPSGWYSFLSYGSGLTLFLKEQSWCVEFSRSACDYATGKHDLISTDVFFFFFGIGGGDFIFMEL